MSNKTAISWTERTWNPVTGCSHVSPGCLHCYAETLSLRYGWSKKPWTAQNAAENVVLHPNRLNQPLSWREPAMCFVNSMSDLFHEQVPFEFIDQVFDVMERCSHHTFQVLTKRPERMLEYTLRRWTPGELPAHVWLGVSVEDQRRANERIPILIEVPAIVRFLSCEPLLGPVDLSLHGRLEDGDFYGFWIGWVIAGGESGPGHRPMNLDWARTIRDQCLDAGIPFFFKQSSALRPGHNPVLDGQEWHQFPESHGVHAVERQGVLV